MSSRSFRKNPPSPRKSIFLLNSELKVVPEKKKKSNGPKEIERPNRFLPNITEFLLFLDEDLKVLVDDRHCQQDTSARADRT